MKIQLKLYRLTIIGAVFGLLAAGQVIAASVPHTFASGTPANAAEVNENFQALADSLSAVEGTSFTGYELVPSASGELGFRTVIVYDAGGGCYLARGIFTNTAGETVDTPSGQVTPDFIYIWQYLCGDEIDVTYENDYVYALPAGSGGAPDWLNAQGIAINEDSDGDGVFDISNSYNYFFDSKAAQLTNMEIFVGGDVYLDSSDEILFTTSWNFLRSDYPRPLVVNGLTFNDVIVDRYLSIDRMRFRAQGIGTILEIRGDMNGDPVFGNQSSRGVIFYRQSDGTTGGSATGTPFAIGSTGMINKWFNE